MQQSFVCVCVCVCVGNCYPLKNASEPLVKVIQRMCMGPSLKKNNEYLFANEILHAHLFMMQSRVMQRSNDKVKLLSPPPRIKDNFTAFVLINLLYQ